VIHCFRFQSYPEYSDGRISVPNGSEGNDLKTFVQNLGQCLKLSRKHIAGDYLTGDTLLLALFLLITDMKSVGQSSLHLIYGYIAALRWIVDETESGSFEERLFASGITESVYQSLDNALWGTRKPDVASGNINLDANFIPFFESAMIQMSRNHCFFIDDQR